MMKWLKEKGCVLDKYTGLAASRGHLEILKWAVENGMTWDNSGSDACRTAASEGHLEILKWLLENGCRSRGWEQTSCNAAAEGGHLKVLTWIVENNNADYNWSKIAHSALYKDKLNIVKYLVAKGYPIPWPDLVQERHELSKIPVIVPGELDRRLSFKLIQFLKLKGLIPFDKSLNKAF